MLEIYCKSEAFCDEKHLLTSVICTSPFHRSLSQMVECMTSEGESDTLIYENMVEIKQKKKKKNGTFGEMIHSSVNVGRQAKYLEIYIML